jgi:hypothetical protein
MVAEYDKMIVMIVMMVTKCGKGNNGGERCKMMVAEYDKMIVMMVTKYSKWISDMVK